MGYRYYTEPIVLTEASADLAVACALVSQVPEVKEDSLEVDFTGWKSAYEHVGFLFSLMASCGDKGSQCIRVEGESDDDVEHLTYEPENYPERQLSKLIVGKWGSQPAQAGRDPRARGYASQTSDLDQGSVAKAIKALDVQYALGILPAEDYGHTTPSFVASRLRRFDFLNSRLRGNTLEETYQARRGLLAKHGIQLADSLSQHICLAAADPYNR